MPKAITQGERKRIAEMIRKWPPEGMLTWNTICSNAKSILGYVPTRQALSKKNEISGAYHAKKERCRLEVEKFQSVPRPKGMVDAMEKIARLSEENELLKTELGKMAEVAQRFIYNASIAGVPYEKLKAPLPRFDKD